MKNKYKKEYIVSKFGVFFGVKFFQNVKKINKKNNLSMYLAFFGVKNFAKM